MKSIRKLLARLLGKVTDEPEDLAESAADKAARKQATDAGVASIESQWARSIAKDPSKRFNICAGLDSPLEVQQPPGQLAGPPIHCHGLVFIFSVIIPAQQPRNLIVAHRVPSIGD